MIQIDRFELLKNAIFQHTECLVIKFIDVNIRFKKEKSYDPWAKFIRLQFVLNSEKTINIIDECNNIFSHSETTLNDVVMYLNKIIIITVLTGECVNYIPGGSYLDVTDDMIETEEYIRNIVDNQKILINYFYNKEYDTSYFNTSGIDDIIDYITSVDILRETVLMILLDTNMIKTEIHKNPVKISSDTQVNTLITLYTMRKAIALKALNDKNDAIIYKYKVLIDEFYEDINRLYEIDMSHFLLIEKLYSYFFFKPTNNIIVSRHSLNNIKTNRTKDIELNFSALLRLLPSSLYMENRFPIDIMFGIECNRKKALYFTHPYMKKLIQLLYNIKYEWIVLICYLKEGYLAHDINTILLSYFIKLAYNPLII